ncbi:ATP-binding protein [Streptomyces coffeae]|uniref:ATP-binding protein n=1 Tax=Streptomyces coffeae TaxID=621382 RepID=A0ABS1NAV0_9ACTN|nr:ATP-binding protein [Streptomyces coffeae]MBL1097188.1 ATP-binding protein [Streptomyces coffeae]
MRRFMRLVRYLVLRVGRVLAWLVNEQRRHRDVLHPLDRSARAVSQARGMTRDQLAKWDLHEHAETAELLVSELVTNALRHAWGPIQLRLIHSPRRRRLRCDIADGSPDQPRLLHARLDAENGRGLRLLDQLSASWGARPTAHGKTVWFELRTRASTIARLRTWLGL